MGWLSLLQAAGYRLDCHRRFAQCSHDAKKTARCLAYTRRVNIPNCHVGNISLACLQGHQVLLQRFPDAKVTIQSTRNAFLMQTSLSNQFKAPELTYGNSKRSAAKPLLANSLTTHLELVVVTACLIQHLNRDLTSFSLADQQPHKEYCRLMQAMESINLWAAITCTARCAPVEHNNSSFVERYRDALVWLQHHRQFATGSQQMSMC